MDGSIAEVQDVGTTSAKVRSFSPGGAFPRAEVNELDSGDRGIGGQTLTADYDRAVAAGEAPAGAGEITGPAGRRDADRRRVGETPVQRLKARLKAASDT